MKFPLIAAALGVAAAAVAAPAFAAFWQEPITQDCSFQPGEDCVVDAKCPGYQHAATVPAFEIVTEPKTARVGVVSMVPVDANGWRVTWRNFGDDAAEATASVRLRCGKDIKWGG